MCTANTECKAHKVCWEVWYGVTGQGTDNAGCFDQTKCVAAMTTDPSMTRQFNERILLCCYACISCLLISESFKKGVNQGIVHVAKSLLQHHI